MKKIAILGLLILLNTAIAAIPVFAAGSKYSDNFKKHFSQCLPYKESKYNVIYNANSTYEIKGYMPDGSERCVYVETNVWMKGKNTTTCLFSPPQLQEYYNAMLNPDIKHSVTIGAMPIVDAHEEAVYLKYYNDPKVCSTVGSFF